MATTESQLRIERVVAAIEAISQARSPQQVSDAREVLRCSLRDFLKPKLRLLDGGKQDYPESWKESDKPVCLVCHKNHCCDDQACPAWHAAIRRVVTEEKKTP